MIMIMTLEILISLVVYCHSTRLSILTIVLVHQQGVMLLAMLTFLAQLSGYLSIHDIMILLLVQSH